MKGTRKEPNEDGQLMLAEGEYGKGKDGIWYGRPPGSHMGNFQGHQVTEHEDGTITISPSILITGERGQWHGFLERGIWRQV